MPGKSKKVYFDNSGFFYEDEHDEYGRLRSNRCPAYANYNMKAVLPYIHYSNPYWNEARTIWGAEEKGIAYDYSDRLWEWDYNKAEAASKGANEKLGAGQLTPEWIQLYLSLYFGKEVELRHVMGGVNVGNGYNYYVYGYRIKDK